MIKPRVQSYNKLRDFWPVSSWRWIHGYYWTLLESKSCVIYRATCSPMTLIDLKGSATSAANYKV